jgi:hypothetical protein
MQEITTRSRGLRPKTRQPAPSALQFRRAMERASAVRLPTFAGEFGLWHHHVDWDGGASRSRLHRRWQLWALFKLLTRVERHARALGSLGPYQVFVCIDERDPGSDAVYVHTPNINGSPFPYEPHAQRWLTAAPWWWGGRISAERYEIAVCLHGGERYFFVRRRAGV